MAGEGKAVVWRPWYRLIQWSAVLVLFLLLLAGFLLGRFHSPMGQLAFCAFGILTGAAFARMAHPVDGRLTRLGCVALGFVAASQVFYQMLVWSESWRENSWNNIGYIGWRLWWATIVTAVGLGWLQVLWRSGARWEWKSGRTTLGFTAGLGLLLGWLSIRENPMATLPGLWHGLAAVMSAGAVIGSAVIIGRWMKGRPKTSRPLPKWMRPALIVGGLMTLSAGSFYVGRLSVPPPSPFEQPPQALGALANEKLEERITTDFKKLRELTEGLEALQKESEELDKKIKENWAREGRIMYTPTQDSDIRSLFAEYLYHREVLIQMAVFYSSYDSVKEEGARARAYLLGYGSAAVALAAGRQFVLDYMENKHARAKLNEGELGLRPGMFEEVYQSVASRDHIKKFKEQGRVFDENRFKWEEKEVFSGEDLEWIYGQIQAGRFVVEEKTKAISYSIAWLSRVGRRLKEDAYKPVYGAQELVATFVGDTRIVRRQPFIPVSLVQKTLKKHELQPGDIILERRNWYLSNAFLPGFWPHTALYIGKEDQLEALEKGLVSDLKKLPERKPGAAWEAYIRRDHGHPRVILEAVSDGVVFASAEHSLHADYVALVRPNLSPSQKATAIRRAFADYGKPYDFNFDFNTASKLVCSELVYHAYEGLLDFQMEDVLGKKVVTPLGIMRKFANEYENPNPQLEFVFFLDTLPGASEAKEASLEECRESVNRPKAFNE